MEPIKDRIYRDFRISNNRYDSPLRSYAQILKSAIDLYRIEMTSFVVESTQPKASLSLLKNIINGLRKDAGTKDFDSYNLQKLATEIGIKSGDYLDSILAIKIEDNPDSNFVLHVSRDNYLEINCHKYNYAILEKTALENIATSILELPSTEFSDQKFWDYSETEGNIIIYEYPAYIIRDFLDYTIIKTYIDCLDKLDQILDEISVAKVSNIQPGNLKKDKSAIQAHHLGLLLHIFLCKFIPVNKRNDGYVFAACYLLLLRGELGMLTNLLIENYDLDVKQDSEIKTFLDHIDRITPLSTAASPFISKYYRIAKKFTTKQLYSLQDKNNKELKEKTTVIRKWVGVKKSRGVAFNLVSNKGKIWSFDDAKADQFLKVLKKYYAKLITEDIEKQFRQFKKQYKEKFQ